MNVKRLKKLANYLAKLKDTKHRQFNMGTWFEVTVDSPSVEVDTKTGVCKVGKSECRTSACALGHAAMIPEFQRAGLRIEMHGITVDGGDGTVKLRGFRGGPIEVAQKFFDLPDGVSLQLFGGDDMSAKDKAKHIREVIDAYN